MRNKRFIGILLTVTVLLCIPLIAMQFTNEVNWTLSDFIIASVLLLSAGIIIEAVARNIRNRKTRIGIVLGILIAFFLVWAELAVGIFGTSFAGS